MAVDLTAPDLSQLYGAEMVLAKRKFRHFLPHVRTELGEVPPWAYIAELVDALDSGRGIVWLKRRQILASWLLCARAYHVAWRAPYSHVALISQTGDDASELMRRVELIGNSLPRHLQGGHKGISPMKLANGSTITAFNSTAQAGLGRSLAFALMDEYATHPYASENLAAIQPAINNSGGQLVICSTADPSRGAAGAFYDVWRAASANDGRMLADGTLPLQTLFSGRYCRPDQGDDWLSAERARLALSGKADDASFNAYYPTDPESAFSSHSGLVFGPEVFDRRLNVRAPVVPWAECKWRVAGIDPGGSDPSAIVVVGVSQREELQVYGEKQIRGPISSMDVSAYLGPIHSRAKFDRIYIDKTQTSLIEQLRREGWPAYPASNDKAGRISAMGSLFKELRLFLPRECVDTLHEMDTYWYSERRDMAIGNSASVQTKTPAGHHADLVDALGYAVMGILQGLPGIPSTVAQIGRVERAPAPKGGHRRKVGPVRGMLPKQVGRYYRSR